MAGRVQRYGLATLQRELWEPPLLEGPGLPSGIPPNWELTNMFSKIALVWGHSGALGVTPGSKEPECPLQPEVGWQVQKCIFRPRGPGTGPGHRAGYSGVPVILVVTEAHISPEGKSEGNCTAFWHLVGTCWLLTPPTKGPGRGLIVGKSGSALGGQAT